MSQTETLAGVRLVSWDVDGTLFSYLRLSAVLIRTVAQSGFTRGWGNTLAQLHGSWKFHETVEKQRLTSNSTVIASQLERFAGLYASERKALDDALHRIQPRSRALDMLCRFSSNGITQVALSDFECRYKLSALGINHYFTKIYSCHDLGFWKPSPIPLAMIQRDFGVAPDRHLHIGDRLDTDGEACARNGCRFMLIDNLPRPWKVFKRICAIPALE